MARAQQRNEEWRSRTNRVRAWLIEIREALDAREAEVQRFGTHWPPLYDIRHIELRVANVIAFLRDCEPETLTDQAAAARERCTQQLGRDLERLNDQLTKLVGLMRDRER